MSAELLTRDNPSLQRPTMDALTHPATAINCTDSLPPPVADYVRDSMADSTKLSYQSDLAHFAKWGASIPATDQQIASYLAAHAETLAVATLSRRLASLSRAHEAGGYTNPTRFALVKATLRGIKRTRGTAQRQ